ncbi:monocarboxylate transporter 13-like [Ptychodera flava]|uniref:monocarboxylate transporter 13-like n=1 Tax=Ptychodera flava TaxID=63121 RepID=UPI00396A3E56
MSEEGPIHVYDSPDGGYGWIVALGGFGVMLFTPGLTEAFGVFFIKFRTYFGVSAQSVSWIVSIMMSMTFFASPIAAGLSNKFGIRPVVMAGGIISSVGLLLSSFATSIPFLYVTFGVITGGAYGFVAVPVILLVGYYFQKKHAPANGLMFAGASLGVVIFPPLCHYLLEHLGWRGSLILISAMNLNLCVFASLMRMPPLKKNLPAHMFEDPEEGPPKKNLCGREKKRSTRPKLKTPAKGMDCSIWGQNYMFTVYVIAVFFLGFSTFTPLVHLVPRAVYQGTHHGQAAWIVSVIGVTGFIGRLIHGIPISRGWVGAHKLFLVCVYLIGFITIIFGPVGTSFARIMGYAVLYGVLSGFYNPMTMVMMKLIVETYRLPTGMGITLLFYGVGHLVGAPVAGRLYDITGSYRLPFMVAGVTYLISAVLLSFKPMIMKCQAGKNAQMAKQKEMAEMKEKKRAEREERRARENAKQAEEKYGLLARYNGDPNRPLVNTTVANGYRDYSDDDRGSYPDSLNDTNV